MRFRREWPAEMLATPIQVWVCLNPDHGRVTWTGDVATCDTCGLTSEMTDDFARGVRDHEREHLGTSMARSSAEVRDQAVAAERERCAREAEHPDTVRLVAETIGNGMIIRQGPPEIARSALAGVAAQIRAAVAEDAHEHTWNDCPAARMLGPCDHPSHEGIAP